MMDTLLEKSGSPPELINTVIIEYDGHTVSKQWEPTRTNMVIIENDGHTVRKSESPSELIWL